MVCPDCGDRVTVSPHKPDVPCFRCNGSGSLCDVCGEACEAGLDLCPDCEGEEPDPDH